MTMFASVVLCSRAPQRTATFLAALGIDLEHEVHDDGPEHWATELGDVHVAVYGADSASESRPLPWGCRIVVEDPDGRHVEVNQTHHCEGS